jgi:nucleotide-binding universal stress UspA family protein
MKEIIVGYDGSQEAERAIARAADVAEAFASHLIVVSVTQPTVATSRALEAAISSPMVAPGAAGPVAVPTVEQAPVSDS